MKKNAIFVLIVALIFSTISVTTMLNNRNTKSSQTYANKTESNTQGDIKPDPFNDLQIIPVSETDINICKNQKKIN